LTLLLGIVKAPQRKKGDLRRGAALYRYYSFLYLGERGMGRKELTQGLRWVRRWAGDVTPWENLDDRVGFPMGKLTTETSRISIPSVGGRDKMGTTIREGVAQEMSDSKLCIQSGRKAGCMIES